MSVWVLSDNSGGHEEVEAGVPVHDHEHDGEESDHPPQSGHARPALRPVVPRH